MKKRRLFATVLATVCLGTAVGATAFAADPVTAVCPQGYALCSQADCAQLAQHDHDGITYSGHYGWDGHASHGVCQAADCALTTTHDHNGMNYLGHSAQDGHGHNRGNNGHGCGNGRGGGHHHGR